MQVCRTSKKNASASDYYYARPHAKLTLYHDEWIPFREGTASSFSASVEADARLVGGSDLAKTPSAGTEGDASPPRTSPPPTPLSRLHLSFPPTLSTRSLSRSVFMFLAQFTPAPLTLVPGPEPPFPATSRPAAPVRSRSPPPRLAPLTPASVRPARQSPPPLLLTVSPGKLSLELVLVLLAIDEDDLDDPEPALLLLPPPPPPPFPLPPPPPRAGVRAGDDPDPPPPVPPPPPPSPPVAPTPAPPPPAPEEDVCRRVEPSAPPPPPPPLAPDGGRLDSEGRGIRSTLCDGISVPRAVV